MYIITYGTLIRRIDQKNNGVYFLRLETHLIMSFTQAKPADKGSDAWCYHVVMDTINV